MPKCRAPSEAVSLKTCRNKSSSQVVIGYKQITHATTLHNEQLPFGQAAWQLSSWDRLADALQAFAVVAVAAASLITLKNS